MRISENKAARLRSLATGRGVIGALAIDQRKSLRIMIAQAAGAPIESITDAQLAEFKASVTAALTPHASAILVDPEYGLDALPLRSSGCGLLLTYEMDGYENPRPNRMLALMPDFSVRRLRELGADGVKILLSWAPADDPAANEQKQVMIERIGAECDALDMPFFLEPVGYDPDGLEPRSVDYARQKPDIVIRTMEEFSKDHYRVDVLKVEFPVNAAYVEGCSVCCGNAVAYTRQAALDYFRQADAVARRPYIYLSAGVSSSHFLESLGLASESGARFSGVLCGRATWQDGVAAYAQGGRAALDRWLGTEGVRNIRAVNECLASAYPWTSWID